MNIPDHQPIDSFGLWHPPIGNEFVELAGAKSDISGRFLSAKTAARLGLRPQLTAQRRHFAGGQCRPAKHGLKTAIEGRRKFRRASRALGHMQEWPSTITNSAGFRNIAIASVTRPRRGSRPLPTLQLLELPAVASERECVRIPTSWKFFSIGRRC